MLKLGNGRKTTFFIILCILYILTQYAVLDIIGNQAALILGTVPILLTSWWFGHKWTILMGLVVAAIQPVLYQIEFKNLTPVVLTAGTGAIFLTTFVGVLLSRMKELTGTVIAQIALMKMAEEEKAKLQEQLHQSQKMEALGQLASGIAHDFNNILGAITGFSELLSLQYSDTDEKLAMYVNAIHDASLRGTEMTSNLLTFARKKKFELLPVDLHCLVKKLVELLQHTIDKKVVVSHQLSKGKDQMRCRGGEKSIYVDSLSPRVERGLGGH